MNRVGPIVISTADGSRLIERAGFVREAELEELLRLSPDLLKAIAGGVRHAFVGRHVPTIAGELDLLFVDASGVLTVVESKLAKNPEARRIVVGQVFD